MLQSISERDTDYPSGQEIIQTDCKSYTLL